MKHNKTLAFLVIIFVISQIIWGALYFSLKKSYLSAQNIREGVSVNTKTLLFLDVFVKEVLQSKGEIDFEKRLALENAVREIGDEEVSASWRVFLNSPTEKDAQDNVTKLLSLLISKIQTLK